MVDYRKWDKFAAELSDDEDDDIAEGFGKPQVTKLEGSNGGSVRIGPNGAEIIGAVSQEFAASSAAGSCAQAICSSRKRAHDNDIAAMYSENGCTEERYFWSQKRNEVTISVLIENAAKAKEMAVSLSGKLLEILWKGSPIFVERLQYDVEQPEDYVDWEFAAEEYRNCRIMQINLRKKSPIAGAAIWWKNAFVGGTAIDVAAIQGRDPRNMQRASVWEEAHSLFQERIKDINPVDIGSES